MQSQRRARLQGWQVGVVLGVCVLVGAVGGFWLGVGASAWYRPVAVAEPTGIMAPGPFDFRFTPPPPKPEPVGTLI